ncbi:hypothetical protein [Streptomyces sp. NPDC006274]|uniref:hypothetical protein n=1 Tax=unclassified Streptomyces TaxID=2593676 RepID=UPI0033B1CAF8
MAVAHWLLAAATDIPAARTEWATTYTALLRCGGGFAAVRIPATIVQAAAGTADPAETDAYLTGALDGPVFVDQHSQQYYALVPASMAQLPKWVMLLGRDAQCLGRSTFVGVPHPGQTDPRAARSYWCVPMNGPGVLCGPHAVVALVARGRDQQRALVRGTDE